MGDCRSAAGEEELDGPADAVRAEAGDDSPAGGGHRRAGLAVPGGGTNLNARGRVGGDSGGERGKVFEGEAIGADNSREGRRFQRNHGIDHVLVGDQYRARGLRAGVEAAVKQDEDVSHNAGPAA